MLLKSVELLSCQFFPLFFLMIMSVFSNSSVAFNSIVASANHASYSLNLKTENKEEVIALLITTKILPGAKCVEGGTKVAVGLDTNTNLKLDDHEIDYVEIVCTNSKNMSH